LTLTRPEIFLILTALAFFNPVTLLLFEFSLTFTFVVPFTLFVWFAARWDKLSRIEEKSQNWEKILGLLIYAVNVARNMLFSAEKPMFGLSDMLIAFFSVCVAFYGFKALKQFKLPLVYMVVLIVGYEIEFAITEVVFLQNFLASTISTLLNLLGIGSIVYGNLVSFQGLDGKNHSLMIDAPCTGIKGMLAYGSLAILMIIDVEAPLKKKMICVVVGAVGTFLVNILRLLAIFLSCYFFGDEAAMAVHTYLGYSLFIIWVFIYWIIAFRYLA
jgi:exosortase